MKDLRKIIEKEEKEKAATVQYLPQFEHVGEMIHRGLLLEEEQCP